MLFHDIQIPPLPFNASPSPNLANDGNTSPTIAQIENPVLISNANTIRSILGMDRSLSIAVLVLPDFVFATAVVLEFGTVLAAAVREVVAYARRVGAAVHRLAIAGAGGPDLGVGSDALVECSMLEARPRGGFGGWYRSGHGRNSEGGHEGFESGQLLYVMR